MATSNSTDHQDDRRRRPRHNVQIHLTDDEWVQFRQIALAENTTVPLLVEQWSRNYIKEWKEAR